MFDWAAPLNWLIQPFEISVQHQESIIDFLDPVSFDVFNLLAVTVFLIFFTTLSLAIAYLIQRRRHYLFFLEQLKTLGLDAIEEGTFIYMVKNYSLTKPVRALESPRIFDEMASHEMLRILSADESQGTKEKFIDTVYKIRTVTHYPAPSNQNDPNL